MSFPSPTRDEKKLDENSCKKSFDTIEIVHTGNLTYRFPVGYNKQKYKLVFESNGNLFCGYDSNESSNNIMRSAYVRMLPALKDSIQTFITSMSENPNVEDLLITLAKRKKDMEAFIRGNQHRFFDFYGEINLQMVDWVINACDYAANYLSHYNYLNHVHTSHESKDSKDSKSSDVISATSTVPTTSDENKNRYILALCLHLTPRVIAEMLAVPRFGLNTLF